MQCRQELLVHPAQLSQRNGVSARQCQIPAADRPQPPLPAPRPLRPRRGRRRHPRRRSRSAPGPRRTRKRAAPAPPARPPARRRYRRPAPFPPPRPAARRRRRRGRRSTAPPRIGARTKSPLRRSAPRSTGGGGPVLAPGDLAQPQRLAEMAGGRADQQQVAARRQAPGRPRLPASSSTPSPPIGGRGQDAVALGLVVEADIAAHDREVERARRPPPCRGWRRRTGP